MRALEPKEIVVLSIPSILNHEPQKIAVLSIPSMLNDEADPRTVNTRTTTTATSTTLLLHSPSALGLIQVDGGRYRGESVVRRQALARDLKEPFTLRGGTPTRTLNTGGLLAESF